MIIIGILIQCVAPSVYLSGVMYNVSDYYGTGGELLKGKLRIKSCSFDRRPICELSIETFRQVYEQKIC